MARIRRLTATFTCGDSYAAAFIPSNTTRLEVVEGTFVVTTFGATFAVGEGTPTVTAGAQVGVNGTIGLGPIQMPGTGWRLDQTFFRNTTAGSNAVVTFVGTVREVVGVPEVEA